MGPSTCLSRYPSNRVSIFKSAFHLLPSKAVYSTSTDRGVSVCPSVSVCDYVTSVCASMYAHAVLRAADAMTVSVQLGEEPSTLIGSHETPQENTDCIFRNGHRGTIS